MTGPFNSYDFNSLVSHITGNIGDYDSTKQMPVAGPYRLRSPEEKETSTEPVLRRLEDIDASWVENYIRSGIIGYKTRGNGLSTYLRNTKEAIIFQNSDGEFLTSADLERDRDNTTDLDVFGAKEKLPYLLKRLHFKSKELGVSLISIYGVYLLVGGTEDVKPRDMLRGHTIWRMDKAGNITTPYKESANQNNGFPQAFAYIKGFQPDEYYKDLLEFRDVLEILGIKLWEEDPHDFDEAFISRLIVKYVMSNNEFLWRGQRRDPTVMNALSSVSVSDWGFNHASTLASRVRSFVSTFVESESSQKAAYMQNDPECISKLNYFLGVYSRATGDNNFYKDEDGRLYPLIKDMDTYDGFFCLPDEGSPYAFNVKSIYGTQEAYALLHKSGHLVLVSQSQFVPCLTVNEAISAFQSYNKVTGTGGVVSWTRLAI